MKEYEIHPYALIFPPMSKDDFDTLASDIQANGLRDRITLYNSQIIDGRNRYRACANLGIKLGANNFDTFEGDDEQALDFVFSKNFARRHLDESQRAMVAARRAQLMAERAEKEEGELSANLPKNRGRPNKGIDAADRSASKAANVSERSTRKARKVLSKGTPELVAAVDEGKVSVDAASKIADLSPEEQKQIVADQNPKTAAKKVARANKERALAIKQCAFPQKRYGVIYADPAWRFQTHSDNGMDRAADNHYPTMETDAICALDVASIATDDCVLFLWATAPMLPDALRVMAAWGFEYKSNAVWAKDRVGTGYWFRNAHEHILVGVRGDVPCPAMGDQWESVINAPVGAHSEKPEEAYELIEAYFPNLPKIELNARQRRVGWDSWGLECPE